MKRTGAFKATYFSKKALRLAMRAVVRTRYTILGMAGLLLMLGAEGGAQNRPDTPLFLTIGLMGTGFLLFLLAVMRGRRVS